MRAMEIEQLAVSALVPYAKNTKAHPEDQVRRIAASIREFGFNTPVIVDGDGVLVAGHGRLLAAQHIGLQQVPALRVDHLNREQVRAYRIADNKTAESAWLDEVLQQELADLEAAGYNLQLTGFDGDQLEELLSVAELGDPAGDPDEVPDPPENPLTQSGDLWLLDGHRLLCGDSENSSDMRRLCSNPADLLFTDPPYNVDYGDKVRYLNNGRGGIEHRDIANDAMDAAGFGAFLERVFVNVCSVMRPGAAFYVFHSDSYGLQFRQAIVSAGLDLKQVLVWVKNSAVMSRQDYHWRHEPILYGWKPGAAHTFIGGRKQNTVADRPSGLDILEEEGSAVLSFFDGVHQIRVRVGEYEILPDTDEAESTVWKFPKPNRNPDHPTMKPAELVARGIRNSCRREGIVLDPFLGSGTTLIASEMTNRRCFGLELDRTYCDVIVRRWEKFTGKKAERIVAGTE